MTADAPSDDDLAEIERTAVDLATLGGARIGAALGRNAHGSLQVFWGGRPQRFATRCRMSTTRWRR